VPGEWTVAHCGTCDFYFQAPLPEAKALPSFYPATYSAYAQDATTGWMFRMTYWLDARRVAGLIGRRGRILDVGCGNGAALVAMRAHGAWELAGLELDEMAAAKARAIGLPVEAGELATADLPPSSVDLIRMGHVIEHVLDPVRTLRRAYEVLRPGGILFGETPNTACWDFRLFGRYWGALHLPRHITFFNADNLTRALEDAGFVDVRIAPRLRTVGWSAGIQNLLADRLGVRVPPGGRVRWYPLLIVLGLPLTFLQALLDRPATIAFTARKPGARPHA
jgi:SAM-dependent methyltransferase